MIWCIKTYIIAYVKTQKIRFIIHYVKPTAQLLFKIRFPKGGPTISTDNQVVAFDGHWYVYMDISMMTLTKLNLLHTCNPWEIK